MRAGKVDVDAGHLREPFGLSYFTTLIVGQRKTLLRVYGVEHGFGSRNCRCGSCGIHFCQCDEDHASLNQRTNGRRIACTVDQIGLPMARHDAIFDFQRAHMDADHVRNGAGAICTPSARSPTLARLAQAGDQRNTQLTVRPGVKRGVAVLVTDLDPRVVRLRLAQCGRDLLRRLPIAQQSCAVAPKWPSLGQTRWVSCRSRQPSDALLRKRCAMPSDLQWRAALAGTRCRVSPAVAFQLTPDRTRSPLQAAQLPAECSPAQGST